MFNSLYVMDNNSENNKRKCPVCGRFAKAEAVEKHELAVKSMRDALAECREAIAQKDGIIDTMKANLSLYEAEHDKLTRKVDNQRGELSRRENTIAALRQEISERGTRVAEVEMENKELTAKLEVYRRRGLWARIINRDI